MTSFLETTEQLVNNPEGMPDGFRVYHLDGRTIWCSPKTRDYLQSLQDKVQGYLDQHPFETIGDCQDSMITFCRETGLLKPCYQDFCAGCDCDEEGLEFCSSPNESWK